MVLLVNDSRASCALSTYHHLDNALFNPRIQIYFGANKMYFAQIIYMFLALFKRNRDIRLLGS